MISIVLSMELGVVGTYLPAERRQEHHQLNRVDIIRNHNQACLLGLDQRHTMVQPILGEQRLLAVLGGRLLPLGSLGLGFLEETSLLLLLGFGLVLVEELEELGGGVLVQGVGELGDGGRDLRIGGNVC